MKTVLIADDDEDLVTILTRRCESLGLRVDSANNAMTALGKIEEMEPDVVLLDVDMPQGNGLSVCEMISHHEHLSSTPVVIMTGNTSEETVRRCYQLCAYYVPKCPNVWTRIEPLLNELLGLEQEEAGGKEEISEASQQLVDSVFAVIGVERDGSLVEDETPGADAVRNDQPWVLSIEDDEDVALALKLRLQEYGVTVLRASTGSEGYRKAFFSAPRAILLDYELPSGNGDYVLRRLKESPATADIPVVVLTGRRESSIERQMRNLGAAEFLTKPFNWRELRTVLGCYLDDQSEGPPEAPPQGSGDTKATGPVVAGLAAVGK